MKSFVGFGFGPIQSGLMLLEAQASGNFGRFVIAEILPDLVRAVRANRNRVVVNIARADGIEHRELADIEILNPQVTADRDRLLDAMGQADEMATAIPSVNLYEAGGDASVVSLLAQGINPARPQILYASENHNYAAERLDEALRRRCGPERLRNFQALNTVIGKMSGVIQDADAMRTLGLLPMAPGTGRAILVEAFNRILISRVSLPGVTRGITVFEEKDDLLPFEEAKLYGHNAVHALLGYLAMEKGYRVMSQLAADRDLMRLGREAFVLESGAAMVRKHGHCGDPLFTEAGYARYADDLLSRMTNPYLQDEVARVCRDPCRKLGYSDRLIGTMREALAQGVEPVRMAAGAAAALRLAMRTGQVSVPAAAGWPDAVRTALRAIWAGETTGADAEPCIQRVIAAGARPPGT